MAMTDDTQGMQNMRSNLTQRYEKLKADNAEGKLGAEGRAELEQLRQRLENKGGQ